MRFVLTYLHWYKGIALNLNRCFHF